MGLRRTIAGLLAGLLLAGLVGSTGTGARASATGDAGSGGDAGDTFALATAVAARGAYSGILSTTAGDRHDVLRFPLEQDASVSVFVRLPSSEISVGDPIELLDPNGRVVDVGVPYAGTGLSVSGAVTSELELRLSVHRALVPGDYRLHLQSSASSTDQPWELCFMNCEGTQFAPIDTVFGGSLATGDTKVLLVPPSHGDLGNPAGPKVTDYIDATLRGIRRWSTALDAFAADHPKYGYLADITIDIEIFDGITPLDPVGYDVVLGYAAAGPVFRGVAHDSNLSPVEQILSAPFGPQRSRYSGRSIVLSLFGASPRVGQVLYDFPEVVDLEIVTMHEFGHTFGLGHTRTWHHELGPDLMNSPATFIYGDGWAAGDGGERTPMNCLSSLDLYGMAYLYRWLPSGRWTPSFASVSLPAGMDYRRYCA